MLRASKSQILDELDTVTKFRPGLDDLIDCKANRRPLVLVSAALDFVIKHFLRRKIWEYKVELYAAAARCTPTGIKFDFPKLKDNRSVSLKDNTVRYCMTKADAVAYIGDGQWDLQAVRNADWRFTIRNSKLDELYQEQKIQATSVADFKETVISLQSKLSEGSSSQGRGA